MLMSFSIVLDTLIDGLRFSTNLTPISYRLLQVAKLYTADVQSHIISILLFSF
jgi:hypothetical protein